MTYYDVNLSTQTGSTIDLALPHMQEGIKAAHTAPLSASTVAALKAESGVAHGETRMLLGYYAAGDGADGVVRRNTSLTTTNEVTTYDHNSEAGGWERVVYSPVNLLWAGAKRDWTGDQASAFNAASLAAVQNTNWMGNGGELFVPKGTYRFTSALTPRYGLNVTGEGDASILWYDGTGVFLHILPNDTYLNNWQSLRFYSSQDSFTFLRLDGTFTHRFSSVTFQGTHSVGTPKYNQRGVDIINNSGNNMFSQCEFLSLGEPVVTDSIQNFLDECKFGECAQGVIGVATTRADSGMCISHCDFSTSRAPGVNLSHIDIRETASSWAISDSWFEGADKSIIVGRSGVGGPSHFTLENCIIASTVTNVEIQGCRQPYLSNLGLSRNDPAQDEPTHFDIDPVGAAEGTAINLVSHFAISEPGWTLEVNPDHFPPGWFVHSRYTMRVPSTGIYFPGQVRIFLGSGDPNGVYPAPVGSVFLRTDGTGSHLYVKESGGTGNTGWVGK